MAYDKGNRPDSPYKKRGGRRRKKVCVFCGKENNEIDYKDVAKLKRYVSERGKILPRRITGNCPFSDGQSGNGFGAINRTKWNVGGKKSWMNLRKSIWSLF